MSSEREIENRHEREELLREVAHRLRAARERLGLSTESVANRLHLGQRLIEDLEACRLEALPPAAYVAGYVRAYARIVNLPAEEMADYLGSQAKPVTNIEVKATGDQISTRRPRVKWMTYLIITALLVLAVFAWVGWEEAPSPEIASDQLAIPGSSELTILPLVAPQADGMAAGLDASQSEEEQLTLGGEAQSPSIPPRSADAAQAGAAVPALDAQTPQTTLDFSFVQDCWLEVIDAAGRTLAYDLHHAGDELEYHGEAPYRIFLGYAPGVVVRYNGVVYDHSRYQRGDIARFRIGKSSDNRPLAE